MRRMRSMWSRMWMMRNEDDNVEDEVDVEDGECG